MDSSIYIVIAAVISFLIGIIAHRFLFSDGSERLRLSSELKALKKEYSQYKTQVADSLQHTTRLFNQLQAQQDEIQTHLTQTAQTLNHSFDGRQSLLQPHSHYVAYHAEEAVAIKNLDNLDNLDNLSLDPTLEAAAHSDSESLINSKKKISTPLDQEKQPRDYAV